MLTHASDVEFILLKKLRPLEWFDNQHKPNSNFRKLLQERIEKANPRRNLTAKEVKRREQLEAIAKKTSVRRKRAKPSSPNVAK